MQWERFERAKSVAQFLAALVAVGGFVWSGVTGWSVPHLPGWLFLLALCLAFGAGFGSARTRWLAKERSARILPNEPVFTVDYREFYAPREHGWRLRGEPGRSVIDLADDSAFGRVVRLDLPSGVAFDRLLPDDARKGRILEYAGELGVLYARIVIRSAASSHARQVWLRFKRGGKPPTPFEDGSEEWGLYVEPVTHRQQWPVYRIDLAVATNESFGRAGWELAEVAELRLRGRSVIGQIKITADSGAPLTAPTA
jgi:hypothetical protein